MEQYGLDDLAASAEVVLAGLGPLVAGLARLAGEACPAVTLDAMEVLVTGQGRELLRGLVQLALDVQAGREVRLPGVTGADGVPRTRAEPGHGRPAVTQPGEVRVRRIAYRSGVRGAGSLFPRDAVLNVPPPGYSWALQRLAEMSCRSGSHEQGHQFVLAATGVSIGKRQLEQITITAAADAERFYQDRDQGAVPAAGEQEPAGEPGRERVCQKFCARGFSLSGSGCLSVTVFPRYLMSCCPVYPAVPRNRIFRAVPGLMLRVPVFPASCGVAGACCLILFGSRGGPFPSAIKYSRR